MPRILIPILALAVALPCCFGPCAETPAPAPETRSPTGEPAAGTTEEPAPPHVEIDVAGLAADLGSEYEETRAAAATRVEALPLPVRVEVLRTGLRMEGRAAVEAAMRIDWKWLDHDEASRFVRVLWPELATPGREVPYEEMRSVIGSSDLPALLENLPEPLQEDPEYILGNLHRQMRAEHLPLFARLTASTDPRVRGAAFENLVLGMERTDRHREVVMRAILALWPVADEPRLEGDGDAGYPPLLAEALRRLIVHWGDGSHLRGRTAEQGIAEKQWDWARGTIELWLRRWANEETPGGRDHPLLLALARSDRWAARVSAARALGAFPDDESRAALHALVRGGKRGVPELALGALVRRGDPAALSTLEQRAPRWAAPLATLLEAAPARGLALLRLRVLGPERNVAHATLDALDDAIDETAPWLGIVWRDGLLTPLEAAALASDADGWRLARLGATVPDCRTVALAAAATRRLRSQRPDARFLADVADMPLTLAYLEVADADGTRTWLRTWAEREDAPSRATALRLLLRLGDPEHAEDLVAYVESVRGENEDDDEENLRLLARTRAPEVEAYLRKAAERGDTGPLAIQLGLHPAVVGAIEERSGITAADRARFAKEVLAGRPVDGVVAILRAHPDETLWDVGLVKDDRIRAHLERLRRLRHLKQYADAVGELALMGDAAAREETWRVMQAGRYRWVDNAGARVMTLGYDLSTIPFWISELETNCCRGAVTGSIFDELFGIDVDHHHAITAADTMRRWWSRNGTNLVRSRFAGHLVPGPR